MTDNELLLAISDIMEKKLDARIQPITTDIKSIRDDIKLMHNDIQDLKNHIAQIELHLENTTDDRIKFLAENYMPAAKKYEKETAKIEAMQADIDVLKSVVREHSEKLQKIS